MSAGAPEEAQAWAATVAKLGEKRGLRYEPVGGINPKGAPAALCPGGTNRLTGQLTEGFWGASCDADEREEGGFGGKAILPGAILVPRRTCPTSPRSCRSSTSSRSTTTPRTGCSTATRAAGSTSRRPSSTSASSPPCRATTTRSRCASCSAPAFLEWVTTIDNEVDFGITEQPALLPLALRERTEEELKAALKGAGGIFQKIQREMDEDGIHTYQPGPWNAGLEPFPAD